MDGEVLGQFTMLTEAMGAPAALLSLDGRYQVVNDAYATLLGRSATELVSVPFAEVTHAADVAPCLEALAEMAAGKRAWSQMTKRYVTGAGELVWCTVAKTLLRHPVTAAPVGVLSTVHEADETAADEVRVREAEERFRLSFDHAPIGMAVVGLDGRWLSVNRELCRLLGRSEEELGSLRFQDVTHPDDVEADVASARDLFEGRVESYRMEKRYLRPDGSAVWAELTGTVVRRHDGEPLHFVAQVADLTERRSWEQSLREQERRLRALADGSTDFFVYRVHLEPEVSFDYLSEAVEAISGYTASEIASNPSLMFQRVHPDDAELLAARMLDPAASENDVTYRFRHRDGHDIWLKARHVPVMVEGRMVAVEGIASDVTEQKVARQTLAQQEVWFATLVANSTDAVVVTDGHGVVRHVSPSVERILGWSLEEAIGQPIWGFLHPDEISSVQRRFAGGRAGGDGIKVRVRRRSGDWHWMETTVTPRLDDSAVRGVVINARDITDQAAAEAALEEQAVTDVLTGLPNRALLEDRIGRAIVRHDEVATMVAVLAVNLDRFHTVNDTFGQEAGDDLLVDVGARLAALIPRNQTVGRFAGDEFMICAEGFTTVGQVFDLAETVRAALAEPFRVAGEDVLLATSVGVAVVDRPGITVPEAMTSAGLALQEAKRAGGNTIHIFDPDLRTRARERREIEQSLRDALASGAFVLHYQPIVSLHDHQPIGAEALLRWSRPGQGLVSPDQFVPVAEETGLISAIGDWVIDEACRQLAQWRRQPGLETITVSVNVAVQQLDDPGFTCRLEQVLEAHDLPPQTLVIEVTESAAVSENHVNRLNEVHALGVGIALDDFGTHYSSLAHIQRLPVQHIKIDQSFVSGVTTDPGKRAIIMAVAQLARGLRLATVAEGVETHGQAADLVLLGIDRAQGYRYSPPVPADQARQFLSRNNSPSHRESPAVSPT